MDFLLILIKKKEKQMQKKHKRTFDSGFKTRVVLEVLKEGKTISEIASQFDVHPNQMTQWKKDFLENASVVFEGSKKEKNEIKKMKEEQDSLFKTIGEQKMEIEFLKKNLKKLNLL